MKVVLYLPTPGGLTGAPRRLLTLAEYLKGRGMEVCVAAGFKTELIKEARDVGLDTCSIEPVGVLGSRGGVLFGGGLLFRLRTILALILQNMRFLGVVRAVDADVIWLRSSKGIAFGALGALLSRRPVVWDVDFDLPSRGLVRWLHWFGLWSADAIVFQYSVAPQNIFGKDMALRYGHKFYSIIPGINLETLHAYREHLLKRKDLGVRSFVILHVGTICDRKNQCFILEVLEKLKNEGLLESFVRVRFVGGFSDKKYELRVKDTIANKGLVDTVELLGWRDDVHSLMAEADLLVMPSKDEGVPNTVQEAMAIGVPVITSDKGGMPEIVMDGKTGWILGIDDETGEWVSRLAWCFKNKKALLEIGGSASGYAFRHFDTQTWGDEYVSVIQNVLSDSSSKSAL